MRIAVKRRSHSGPVEADETYMGGKLKNIPKAKREKMEGRKSLTRQPPIV